MKRIRLKPQERLAQMRHLLRTRGPQSLQSLAKFMGYADKAGLQGLIKAHGLPDGVCMYSVKAPADNGGGGNWHRHIFEYNETQFRSN